MGKLDNLYTMAPFWVQNALVSVFGVYWKWVRFGGKSRSYQNDFISREKFSAEEWQTYQNAAITELLTICINQVPYYRDHWTSEQKEFAIKGELQKLPLLEKSPLRDNFKRFQRQDQHPFPRFLFYSSGTTGTPIATQYSLSENRLSLALRETRSANWAGVSFSQPRATFSGRLVEPDPGSLNHVYRYNAAEKQVYFSAFHLKPETAQRYVDALFKHHIVWLTGYAVSYYLLARYILDQNIKVPSIKAVITTSEKVTPDMRSIMQQAYGCKVFEEYSSVENALFASQCQHGRLHISPDAGVVEIIRPDGFPCGMGEIGEVVATCLTRTFQPLIRYRIGDLAAWDSEPCPCGRQMPVIKEVVGRVEDIVTGPDGRQLVRFHGVFVNQPHVIEGQIIQETLNDFTVKIVPGDGFSDEDKIDIKHRMYQRLGLNVNINVDVVVSIPRSKSGKFQAVISKVK